MSAMLARTPELETALIAKAHPGSDRPHTVQSTLLVYVSLPTKIPTVPYKANSTVPPSNRRGCGPLRNGAKAWPLQLVLIHEQLCV